MRASAKMIAGSAAVLILGGCAPSYDPELVQAVFYYKDPLGTVLSSENSASELAEKIQTDTSTLHSQFWNMESDPEKLRLADGGFAVWDIAAEGDEIFFGALISSGPRYGSSMYTCFTVQSPVPLDQWSSPYVELDCPQALVTTLGPEAQFVPINYFRG